MKTNHKETRSSGSTLTPLLRYVNTRSLAIAMFVALVGWGGKYFGWTDPDGKVQLALITAFILGIIGGFKARS